MNKKRRRDLLFGVDESLCTERRKVIADLLRVDDVVRSENVAMSLEEREKSFFRDGEHLQLQGGSMYNEVKKFVIGKYVDICADPKKFIQVADDAIHDCFNYIEGICCAIELLRKAKDPEDIGLAITISYKLITGKSIWSFAFDYMEWLMLLITKIADPSINMFDFAPENMFRHCVGGTFITRSSSRGMLRQVMPASIAASTLFELGATIS